MINFSFFDANVQAEKNISHILRSHTKKKCWNYLELRSVSLAVSHFMCHGISSRSWVGTQHRMKTHSHSIYTYSAELFWQPNLSSDLTIIVLLGHIQCSSVLTCCAEEWERLVDGTEKWASHVESTLLCVSWTRKSRNNLDSSCVMRRRGEREVESSGKKIAIYLLMWEMRLTELQRQENSDTHCVEKLRSTATKMQFIQSSLLCLKLREFSLFFFADGNYISRVEFRILGIVAR